MIEIARNHSARMPQDWYQGRINVRFVPDKYSNNLKPYCIDYLVILQAAPLSRLVFISLDSVIDIGFDILERTPQAIAEAKYCAQASHCNKLGDNGEVYIRDYELNWACLNIAAQLETKHNCDIAASRLRALAVDCDFICELIAHDFEKQCQPVPCSTPQTNE